jgi:hypothetical protein
MALAENEFAEDEARRSKYFFKRVLQIWMAPGLANA